MCPDKNLLSAYFDGELDERFASQIESHIATCDSCRQTLESYGDVSSLLHAADSPEGAVSRERTWQLLQSKFSSLYPAPVWRRRLVVPAPVLMAAAFLVIVLGVGLILSLSAEKESGVFDSITRTSIEGMQFVSFDQILEYLDARGNGSALVFTLPQDAKLQFFSEPTFVKASDYNRSRD